MANGPSRDDFAIRATFEDEATEGMRQLSNEVEAAAKRIEKSGGTRTGFIGLDQSLRQSQTLIVGTAQKSESVTQQIQGWVRHGKQFLGTLRDIGAGFGLVFGVGFSFQALLGFFRDAIAESQAFDRQLTLLQLRMRTFGEADVERASKSVRTLATELARVHGQAESTSVGLFNQARLLGLSNEQAERATKLATQFSQEFGVKVEDALTSVALSLTGSKTGFEQLGVMLQARIRDAEDASQALELFEKRARLSDLQQQLTGLERIPGLVAPGAGALLDRQREAQQARIQELRAEIASLQASMPVLSARPSERTLELDRNVKLAKELMTVLGGIQQANALDTVEARFAAINAKADAEIAELRAKIEPLIVALDSAMKTSDTAKQLTAELETTIASINRKAGENIRKLATEQIGGWWSDALVQVNEFFDTLQAEAEEAEQLRLAALNDIRTIQGVGFSAANAIADNFEEAFASIITGAKSGKEAFRDMANAIIGDIARIALRSLTSNIITSIFGLPTLTGLREGGVRGGPHAFGGEPLSFSRFEQSYGSAPMRRFAVGGGVMMHPTRVPGGVAGEDGAEAFVKLRHGRIPVQLEGAGRGGDRFEINLTITSLDPRTAYDLLASDPVRLGQAMATAFQASRDLRQTAALAR